MERHLSAILAGDIVAYSRLMEADEAGTITRQKQHLAKAVTPAIDRHGGRVVKLIGDGILVEFPSVVEAAACAVDIQTEMAKREADIPEDRRILYRIGINLGDVFEEDGDVFGDGVNIAARLEALADPGGICISGTVYDHLKLNIPVTYQPLGEVAVKNISRPVRVYKILRHGETARPAHKSRMPLALAAVAVLGLAGGAAWWWAVRDVAPPARPTEATATAPTTGRQSIAVLPFDNLGGNPEEDYFSDGMTEDLITDLSQVSGLFVIARNTMFTYKSKAVKITDIGRDLGVSYVLEGSVRRSGERIRINAQLIDARTGGHVWADRFDRDLADVFAVQDDVVKRIVAELEISLNADERARLSRADKIDPQAYDHFLQGLAQLRRFSKEQNIEARAHFEQALAIEPGFSRALADLSLTYSLNSTQFWSADWKASARRGLILAEQARDLGPDIAQNLFALSVAQQANGLVDAGLNTALQAVELDPNYADGFANLAFIYNYSGQPNEALAAIARATELNPLKPFFYTLLEGVAHYLRGDFETATHLLERVTQANPQFTLGHIYLAVSYVALDRVDDAAWEIDELSVIPDGPDLQRLRESITFSDPKVKARFISALRTAGME